MSLKHGWPPLAVLGWICITGILLALQHHVVLSSPHIGLMGSFPPAWLAMEQKLRIASCIASNGSQRYQQPHEGEKCFEADLL